MFGNIPPDDTVKLVFNLSQGEDVRGPWNEAPDFEYVAIRSPKAACRPRRSTPTTKHRASSQPGSKSRGKVRAK